MENCTVCREEWFKLDVKDGVCKRCTKSPTKFTAANNMDPGMGAPSDLPELTRMEELMISPVHAMIQLWQVRGGQTKYTGHTCNFFRDVAQFHNRVPLLPEECEVIVMRRRGLDAQTNTELF